MSRIYLLQKALDKQLQVKMTLLSFRFLIGLFVVSVSVSAQQAIELSSPGIVQSGPTTSSQTMEFKENITGSTFTNLTNPVTVTASFVNQQYTSVIGAPAGLSFGSTLVGSSNMNLQPAPVFNRLNAIGGPSNSSFTSNPYAPYGLSGTGIDGTQNYGFNVMATTNMWAGNTGSFPFRVYYGDIVFTFSRPVSDPVIHIGEFGARMGNNRASTEFELPVGSAFSLTKLSGTAVLSVPVSGNKILNSASVPDAESFSGGAACGSVRINGIGISSVTFRVYMRFINGSFPTLATGDAFMIGFSLAGFGLSGNVYNDANAVTDNTINGTATNAGGGLYALAIDANGNVQGTAAVSSGGIFSFKDLFKGTYTTRLSTNTGSLGSAAPLASLPSGWINTGENLGAGAGHDGAVNGNLTTVINTSNVSNANMGIERIPVANSITYTLPNLPLMNSSVVLNGAIGSPVTGTTPIRPNGTDAEDGILTAGDDLVITTLPTNGVLKYNTIPVIAGQLIGNFDPNLLTVQFTGGGYNNVNFTYSYKDAAAMMSVPATYVINFPSGTLLPVTLTSFTATVSNNNSADIVLKWQTSSELNSYRFAIQHSTDGREWEIIGFVSSAGNSNDIINYEYTHHSVSKGVHYYRLKQEDFDGSSELSHIRQVNMDGKDVVQVYPNPATNVLHIVSGQKELKELSVLDITGSKVLSQRVSQRQYSLDISRIPAGTYLLICQYRDGTVAYEKIIKR